MTAPAGKSRRSSIHSQSLAQCFNVYLFIYYLFLHSGSGEIVHPVTIDGNRKDVDVDGGVYSTRLLHDDIPPQCFFLFNYLVTVVLPPPPLYFHEGESY
jgi:hypothetical protein